SKVYIQSILQRNRYVLERYIQTPINNKTVIVGSSLSAHLKFQNDDECVSNIALAGDVALTGLSFLLESTYLPRKLFVEINVPQLGINKELVGKISWKTIEELLHLSPIFHTENIPVNLIMSSAYWFKRESESPQFKRESESPQVNEAILAKFLEIF